VRSSLGRLLAHAEDEQPRAVRARTDALGFGNDGAPGDTAIPASPARAAPSILCGPIEGKSSRRSWSRFAALTNTPRPEATARRPLWRSSAMRASMQSVPSAASIASSHSSFVIGLSGARPGVNDQ
jgi:hypothetical protein